MKSAEQYAREKGNNAPPKTKKYFQYKVLKDIVAHYPVRSGLSPSDTEKERRTRATFAHFVTGMLDQLPHRRWTPLQASKHPFLSMVVTRSRAGRLVGTPEPTKGGYSSAGAAAAAGTRSEDERHGLVRSWVSIRRARAPVERDGPDRTGQTAEPHGRLRLLGLERRAALPDAASLVLRWHWRHGRAPADVRAGLLARPAASIW